MSGRPILLTGFEGFGGFPVNSSWEAVRAFEGRSLLGIPIAVRKLPVSFSRVRTELRRILKDLRPRAVIAFGLAPRRFVAVERWAVSDDDRRPSTLPVNEIVRAIRPLFPARPSDDAGNYVCNAAFHYLTRWAARSGGGEPVGFIHVPPLGAGVTRTLLRRVVRAAAGEAARSLIKASASISPGTKPKGTNRRGIPSS